MIIKLGEMVHEGLDNGNQEENVLWIRIHFLFPLHFWHIPTGAAKPHQAMGQHDWGVGCCIDPFLHNVHHLMGCGKRREGTICFVFALMIQDNA